jgi:hypothetical protein
MATGLGAVIVLGATVVRVLFVLAVVSRYRGATCFSGPRSDAFYGPVAPIRTVGLRCGP